MLKEVKNKNNKVLGYVIGETDNELKEAFNRIAFDGEDEAILCDEKIEYYEVIYEDVKDVNRNSNYRTIKAFDKNGEQHYILL